MEFSRAILFDASKSVQPLGGHPGWLIAQANEQSRLPPPPPCIFNIAGNKEKVKQFSEHFGVNDGMKLPRRAVTLILANSLSYASSG